MKGVYLIMNTFYNQMFNPQYVNQEYYYQILQHEQYEYVQNCEIRKAVKAMHDLCEAMKNIDDSHQQEAFDACLLELALQLNWDKNRR